MRECMNFTYSSWIREEQGQTYNIDESSKKSRIQKIHHTTSPVELHTCVDTAKQKERMPDHLMPHSQSECKSKNGSLGRT